MQIFHILNSDRAIHRKKNPKTEEFQREWVFIKEINRQIMDLLNNIHTFLVMSSKYKPTGQAFMGFCLFVLNSWA